MKNKLLVVLAILLICMTLLCACDLTVNPQDKDDVYTVTFVTNGGSSVATVTVPAGTKIQVPNEPIKDGYTFAGWYTDENCVNAWTFTYNVVNGDIVLYAKWIENVAMYTVAFNSNGGSTVTSLTVASGSKITAPAEPTKQGYTFGGWYVDVDCVKEWDFQSSTVSSDITLYAKWDAELATYTVTFSIDNGYMVNSVEAKEGSKIEEPSVPERDGYTLDGWYKDENYTQAWNFDEDVVNSHITLYAKWVKDLVTYTVSFNSNGGSEVASVDVEEGSVVAEPTVPTKEGYAFDGWYKDADCTQAWDFDEDVVDDDITLYAKWNANSYTITYNNLNGAINENPASYTVESETIVLVNPSARENYVFAGWQDEEGNLVEQIDTASCKDVVLNAVWDAVAYTITYNNLNGATHTNPTSYTIESATITLTNPGAISGYKFVGWYDSEEDGNKVETIVAGNVGDVVLYARWEDIDPMSYFYYTQSGDTYTITGLKDKSQISIFIPNCVTDIGTFAFDGCRALTEVVFEDNSQLVNIGQFAFNGCSNLTSIVIPSSVTYSWGTY